MKTEESIQRQRLIDNIEAIADRHSKMRPPEFVEHKLGGAKYWDMEAILSAMMELHNITVKNTLRHAADNGQVDNIGVYPANKWVIDKEEMIGLENDLLI